MLVGLHCSWIFVSDMGGSECLVVLVRSNRKNFCNFASCLNVCVFQRLYHISLFHHVTLAKQTL